MNINQIMRIVGWGGTLFAGAVAAKGLGEFLPASKGLVWALGGALEVMNIVGLAWLSGERDGDSALRWCMGVLCAVVVLLDVVGVVGQLSSGHQAAINAMHATAGQAAATIEAKLDAARQGVADLDLQIKAVDSEIAAASAAKIAAGRHRGKADAADRAMRDARTQRDALAAKRDAAADKVTALEVEMAAAKGRAINAASEFAAVEFVGKLFGVSPDAVADTLIATFGALLTLFSVVMMLAAGHGPGQAAPVKVEVVKVSAAEVPVVPTEPGPGVEVQAAETPAVTERDRQMAALKGQITKLQKQLVRAKASKTPLKLASAK